MEYYAPNNKKNDMEKSSRFIFKREKQNTDNYVQHVIFLILFL